jgi:DNA-binding transcriptional ArsR family regulator
MQGPTIGERLPLSGHGDKSHLAPCHANMLTVCNPSLYGGDIMLLERLDPGQDQSSLHPQSGQSGSEVQQGIAEALGSRATEAAAFLKALSHEGRLMILCHLAARERSVTELEALLGARQAAVSQQLARLRLEGLVSTRRDGKAIFYRISDPKVMQQVRLMQEIFSVAEAA